MTQLSSELTFEKLIARMRTGDSGAVSILLERYGDAIRREVRFCLLDQRLKRIVGESDIYQSVVSRFVFGLRAGDFLFESAQDIVRLLKVIVRARVAQHARFWSSQRRQLARNRNLPSHEETALRDRRKSVEDAFCDAELLAQALDMMPERDRLILQWRSDGLGWAEIAGRLCCTSSEALRKQHERSMQRIASDITGSSNGHSRKLVVQRPLGLSPADMDPT